MKVKEIIHRLVNDENYGEFRATVPDSTIELIKEHMTSYYDLFKEKEEAFQYIMELLTDK